jgi:transposase
MDFPQDAVERAMTIRDVLVRAISGQYSWTQAANILGMSPRTLRRWRWRMDHLGQTGLIDMRRGRPSPRKASRLEIQRIIALYRERYQGFNCRHFHQIAAREHDVALSYSLVKQVLQAGSGRP